MSPHCACALHGYPLLAGVLQNVAQDRRAALRGLGLAGLGMCARPRPRPSARAPALPVSRGARRVRAPSSPRACLRRGWKAAPAPALTAGARRRQGQRGRGGAGPRGGPARQAVGRRQAVCHRRKANCHACRAEGASCARAAMRTCCSHAPHHTRQVQAILRPTPTRPPRCQGAGASRVASCTRAARSTACTWRV